ncbi:unnamed protein product [Tenebrio molitor]|nr:unnamed protein product [Tenebrio molitor]
MEHVEDPSEEEIEYCTSPEIQDKAHDVSRNLLPEKSRGCGSTKRNNECLLLLFIRLE